MLLHKTNQSRQKTVIVLIYHCFICFFAAPFGSYKVVKAEHPPEFIDPRDQSQVRYDYAVLTLELPISLPGMIFICR